jgi:hypothetical protein
MYVSGAFDEFGVWNRELSNTELAALYNSGTGLFYPFSPSGINNGVDLYCYAHDSSYGNSHLICGGVGYLETNHYLFISGIPPLAERHLSTVIVGSGIFSQIADSLCSYWPLNESSSTRYDIVGQHHMSPEGDVRVVAGQLSNAADFPSVTDKLQTKSTRIIQTGRKTFTFAAWVEIKDSAERVVVSKRGVSGGEWELRASTSAIKFVFDDGQERTLAINGPFAVGEQHYVSCRINYGSKTAYLKIDNQPSESLVFTGETYSNDEPLVFSYAYYSRLDFSNNYNSQYLGVL